MQNIKYDSIKNEFIKCSDTTSCILPQVIWHMTDKCFLSCPYCFSTKTNIETPYEKAKVYMKLFKALGVQKIDIAGGEPLIYDYINAVCNELKALDIYMTITTSGVGSDTNKKWLVEHSDFFSRIILSLDGATEEQHDSLRGKKGTYLNFIKLYNELKQKQCGALRINTVITKIFFDDSNCKKIVDNIRELQPSEWCIIQPHPANEKKNYKEYSVNSEQFDEVVGKINEITASIKEFRTKLIYRYSNNYTSYWVLYPDGKLSQHTSGAIDRHIYSFNEDNINTIIEKAKNSDLWVPISEREE